MSDLLSCPSCGADVEPHVVADAGDNADQIGWWAECEACSYDFTGGAYWLGPPPTLARMVAGADTGAGWLDVDLGLVVRRAHDYARAELVAALGLPVGTGWAEALAEVELLRRDLSTLTPHARTMMTDSAYCERMPEDEYRRARDTLARVTALVEGR